MPDVVLPCEAHDPRLLTVEAYGLKKLLGRRARCEVARLQFGTGVQAWALVLGRCGWLTAWKPVARVRCLGIG